MKTKYVILLCTFSLIIGILGTLFTSSNPLKRVLVEKEIELKEKRIRIRIRSDIDYISYLSKQNAQQKNLLGLFYENLENQVFLDKELFRYLDMVYQDRPNLQPRIERYMREMVTYKNAFFNQVGIDGGYTLDLNNKKSSYKEETKELVISKSI